MHQKKILKEIVNCNEFVLFFFVRLEGSLSMTGNSGNRRRRLNSHRSTENDFCHERQRLYQSNSNQNNYIPLKDGNKTVNGMTTPSRKGTTQGVEVTTTTGNRHDFESSPFSTVCFSRSIVTNELPPVTPSISNPNRQGISQRTTKMLVICSTTFLLFNSPYCAVLLYCIVSKVFFVRTLSILRHFYFMSFCLNFFLYSLCGHRFRHELILLFKSCCRKWISSNNRTQWLRFEKIPPEHSFTRVINRRTV